MSWSAVGTASATTQAPLRSAELGPRADISAVALRGEGRLVVAKNSGQLQLFPEGTLLVPPRAREHLFHYAIVNLWATEERILFQESGGRTDSMWQTYAVSTKEFRPVARGSVGSCGRPLLGGRAAALHGDDQALVLLPFQEDQAPIVIADNPLETSHCVAGVDETIVVTGRSRGLPAAAIHEAGRWQLVRFPLHPSLAAAFVKDDRIVVALPEERVPRPGVGQAVPASGAVYVLERANGSWRIRERIVAATPRDHGLFGFAVDFNRESLFINHMVPGAISSATADLDRIGDPVICEIPWATAP